VGDGETRGDFDRILSYLPLCKLREEKCKREEWQIIEKGELALYKSSEEEDLTT